MRQAQGTAEQAFALIVNDDGTLEVEPGPSFGAEHIADMADTVSIVEDVIAMQRARAS